MGAKDKRSFAIAAASPANVTSATALLREMSADTTVPISGPALTVTGAQATVVVDGDTLSMVKGKTYRLEVQFVRSTGIEETARLVIECPA